MLLILKINPKTNLLRGQIVFQFSCKINREFPLVPYLSTPYTPDLNGGVSKQP